MNQKTLQCQKCTQSFTIEPEDFEFYEKMQVPAPTWCPPCRLQRRLAVKNERALYQRACDLCHQSIISIYPKDTPFPVYCPPCWFSDTWDPMEYGRAYDFSKSFFIQFYELFCAVPRCGLNAEYPKLVNSPYVNRTGAMKDCHMVFFASEDENCLYSTNIWQSKDSVDCTKVFAITGSYELYNCDNCYHSIGSVDCRNSMNVIFSKNLSDCSDCFGCVNLKHKQYCIFNQQYTKEEYEQKIQEFDLGSYVGFTRAQQQARQFWLKFPNKYMEGVKNEDVSGDYISNSKNVHQSFEVVGAENVKYCSVLSLPGTTDAYDYSDWGENSSLVYETTQAGQNLHNVRFITGPWNVSDLEYCDIMYMADNCFGSVNLRNKKYCILNKQYSAEEYQELREKIIAHMNEQPYVDVRGRVYKYGEFFPPEFSPFAYNETAAQQQFPLTKEEVEREGWKWKEQENKQFSITKQSPELTDHIREVGDDICKETIACEHGGTCTHQCAGAFKIIPQELTFYRRMNIPLPRFCHNCRNATRLASGRPYKLWHRTCMCAGAADVKDRYSNMAQHAHGNEPCHNEFETAFAPDRPEIVYCQTCYSAEVE